MRARPRTETENREGYTNKGRITCESFQQVTSSYCYGWNYSINKGDGLNTMMSQMRLDRLSAIVVARKNIWRGQQYTCHGVSIVTSSRRLALFWCLSPLIAGYASVTSHNRSNSRLLPLVTAPFDLDTIQILSNHTCFVHNVYYDVEFVGWYTVVLWRSWRSVTSIDSSGNLRYRPSWLEFNRI